MPVPAANISRCRFRIHRARTQVRYSVEVQHLIQKTSTRVLLLWLFWINHEHHCRRASFVLLEYTFFFFFFKWGLASYLPYWSLEGRRKYLKYSNSLLLLSSKNLLLEWVPPKFCLLRFCQCTICPCGICLHLYPKNFQVFAHLIATSKLLHTLTSFERQHQLQKESNLAKYGTVTDITTTLNLQHPYTVL